MDVDNWMIMQIAVVIFAGTAFFLRLIPQVEVIAMPIGLMAGICYVYAAVLWLGMGK